MSKRANPFVDEIDVDRSDQEEEPPNKRRKLEGKEEKEVVVVPLKNQKPHSTHLFASLYVCGGNDFQALGLGIEVESEPFPTVLPVLKDKHFVCMVAGSQHNAVVIKDNPNDTTTRVMTWGSNDKHILGRVADEEESAVPVEVPALTGKSIVSMSCGDYHMAALAEDGSLYLWGTYKVDQEIGLRPDKKPDEIVTAPEIYTLLPHQTKITKVASCGNRTMVLNDLGEVYEFGWIPRLNPTIMQEQDAEVLLNQNREGLVPRKLNSSKIMDIAGGSCHALAILENGTVCSWGWNNNGELGIGGVDNPDFAVEESLKDFEVAVPRIIEGLVNIIAIACGSHHSLALDSRGKVFSWGVNRWGQLGHGNFDTLKEPSEIDFFTKLVGDKVVSIGCGCDHSFAVTELGKVYGFGSTIIGQLGGEKDEGITIPRLVRKLDNLKVIQADGGSSHSCFLVVPDAAQNLVIEEKEKKEKAATEKDKAKDKKKEKEKDKKDNKKEKKDKGKDKEDKDKEKKVKGKKGKDKNKEKKSKEKKGKDKKQKDEEKKKGKEKNK